MVRNLRKSDTLRVGHLLSLLLILHCLSLSLDRLSVESSLFRRTDGSLLACFRVLSLDLFEQIKVGLELYNFLTLSDGLFLFGSRSMDARRSLCEAC